jgi:hypothetical protein
MFVRSSALLMASILTRERSPIAVKVVGAAVGVIIGVVVLACGAMAVLARVRARARRHIGIVIVVENTARIDGDTIYI